MDYEQEELKGRDREVEAKVDSKGNVVARAYHRESSRESRFLKPRSLKKLIHLREQLT